MSEIEPTKQTRRQHITREEEADRCLNHTTYSGGSQTIIVALFLLIVFGVPLMQHVYEIRKNLQARAEWKASSGQPEPRLAPQVYDVFKLLPSFAQIEEAKGFWGYWGLIPSAESIGSFESSLKENSILTKKLLSPTQAVMTGWMGVGNEKAYVGQYGSLFYRPDVEYLTSGPFLDPDRLKAIERSTTPIQPDPIKALVDFKRQLSERGIRLIVVPIPTKPMIDPERLVGPPSYAPNLQNPSFGHFTEALASEGIDVFDATAVLRQDKWKRVEYLDTDTHWKPGPMGVVARYLSEFIDENCDLPDVDNPDYIRQPELVKNLGDIAEMLKLPKDQTIFSKQAVRIDRIFQADGQPWVPDHKADVLLLGDSFSNIYSLGGMGWGANAGFAEQISFDLGRPVDKIVINAGGAFASRRELARQLASGVDRLANKKVVILEFSMRDLAQGDWKLIPLAHPVPVEPAQATQATKPGKTVVPPAPTASHPGLGPGPTQTSTTPGKSQTANPAKPMTEGSKPGSKPINAGKTPATKTNGTKPTQPGTKPTTPIVKPNTIVKPTQPTKPVAQDGLMVTGRIAARATTPKPGSVPYKDCLIALQITDIQASGGTIKGPNIVVYVWGMRDNQLVDGAYSVGQTLKFKLKPWASVESKYGGYNRQELESDDSLSWAAFWGEISK